MKNIANADRPKSVGAMLPPRPFRRSGKVAQTACNSDRREGKRCIPTLNQTFADSRILKIPKFPTFRIAGRGPWRKIAEWAPFSPQTLIAGSDADGQSADNRALKSRLQRGPPHTAQAGAGIPAGAGGVAD